MTPARPWSLGTAPDLTLAATEVAQQWLRTCLRERLSTLGVTAADLATATKRSDSNWRSKLNGARSIQVEDLLMIAMTVDPDLFTQPPFDSTDLAGYFPPEYRSHLSHTSPARALPTFNANIWDSVSAAVADWLREEQSNSRGWLIDATGLAHCLVREAAEHGLPSTTVTLAGRTDTRLDIEWIAQDLIVRVAADATTGDPTASEVRRLHRAVIENIVEIASLSTGQKILTQLMNPTALATLGEIAGFVQSDQTDWQVLALGQLHQLARDEDWATTEDIHVRVERYDPGPGLLCLWIK